MGRLLSSYGQHLGLAAGLLGAFLAARGLRSEPPRALPASAPAAAGSAQGPGAGAKAPGAGGRTARAQPYVAGPVEQAGTIRVTCRLSAPAPASVLPFNKDQGAAKCGHAERPNERAAFDPATLGLPNCIVWLSGIAAGRDFEGEMASFDRTLDQHECRYEPPVLLVRQGTRLSVKNSDPVQHNVKGFYNTRATSAFNLMSSSHSLLPPGDDTTLTKAGSYLLACDIHLWMTGVVRACPHPYHAVTAADGTCALTGVPPGTYTLKCWHAGMLLRLEGSGAEVTGYRFSDDFEEPSQTVTVPAAGTVEAAFTIQPR